MKKRTKLILQIGGCMILIGLCLAGIGIAAGGKNYVLHTDLNKLDGSATEEQYKLLEEKTELGELQIIDVDLDNYDFEVRTSTDEKYYLYYNLLSDSQKSGFSYEVEDGTFTLREKRESNGIVQVNIDFLVDVFGGNTSRKDKEETFILYVPEDSGLAVCKINMSNSDLSLNGLTCDEIQINLGYGGFTMENCSSKGGLIHLSDGNMKAAGNALTDMEISLNYGDMHLDGDSLSNVKIDMSDGNMKGNDISLTDGEISLNYGSIYLDKSSLRNSRIEKSDGDLSADELKVLGDVTVESSYGDVSIKLKEAQKDKISLDLGTAYGKIRMDDSFMETGFFSGENRNYFKYVASNEEGILEINASDGDIEISSCS